MQSNQLPVVKIAIEGCCHGELNNIYQSIEQKGGADIVLIAGDFQALRNPKDLNSLSVPLKYKKMGDFYEYYSGKKKAPYLTVFVGGNHEASNYLDELFYGGWVAPNIYYLGRAGCVIFNGLRIAGLSGIFKHQDHFKGHFERVPYNSSTIKSIYHYREFEIIKLSHLRSKPDIMLSHDWPNNVEKHGNVKLLKRLKPFFINEIDSNQLGSPPCEFLLHHLKPRFWYSAHLHVYFKALIRHKADNSFIKKKKCEEGYFDEEVNDHNPDEIDLDSNINVNISGKDNRLDNVSNPDEIDLENENSTKLEINPDEIEIHEGKQIENQKVNINTDINNFNEKEDVNQCKMDDKDEEYDPQEALDQKKLNDINNDLEHPIFTSPKRPNNDNAIYPDIEVTEFLALDKCLNKRKFLEIVEISVKNIELYEKLPKNQLCYDMEWLAITAAFHPFLPRSYLANLQNQLPNPHQMNLIIDQNFHRLEMNLQNIDDSKIFGLPIPLNFKTVAPIWDGTILEETEVSESTVYPNEQTQKFCELLKIKNIFNEI